MVEGAVLYQREGLGDPPDVLAATEQYRGESDRLREFFEDRCLIARDGDANSWKKEGFWFPSLISTPTIPRGPKGGVTNTPSLKGSSTSDCRNSEGYRIGSGRTAGGKAGKSESGSASDPGSSRTTSSRVTKIARVTACDAESYNIFE